MKKNDLSGKKLALFFSDSSRKAVEKTKAILPNSTFVGELAFPAKEFENREEAQKKIVEWCSILKIE